MIRFPPTDPDDSPPPIQYQPESGAVGPVEDDQEELEHKIEQLERDPRDDI
jgi:hypothetical protein